MKQHVQQEGIQFDGILKAGYDLAYTYSNEKPHQIANIQDDSYRTESDTIANDVIKRNHAYEYDANGNLVYVNTGREKQDGQAEDKAQEKKMVWDEENRLQSIYTNGFIAGYWYDAAGERVIKTSGDDEGIYVNDIFSGGRTETADFTAYINPYLVVSKGGSYTKHIYIGSQRIVSKLGDLDSYGQDPRRIEYAGSNVDGAKVDYKSKYAQSQQAIKDNYANFEVPYYGKDNDDYVNGEGFCCDNTKRLKSFDPSKNDNPELFQYYYHSDHLGSSSLITNLDGEVVQHIEYLAFGEPFLEERNNTWNTPYLFNAKELDEETGLYYYGARYYDPRVSLWLSTDPLQEKYPNISTYAYAAQNPVKYIDPDGKEWGVTINSKGQYVITLDIKLVLSEQTLKNLSPNKIESYKKAIDMEFRKMLEDASDGKVTGSVSYNGGKHADRLTPTLALDYVDGGKIGGYATNGYINLPLLDKNGNLTDKEDMSLDAIHELFHTVRLEHPFELTQSEDTELIHNSGTNFRKGEKTDPNILFNIMMYNYITVDGIQLQKGQKQNKLTKGQIQVILLNIIMQKYGAGSDMSKPGYQEYWNKDQGKPVIPNE